jgi:hypothetical protein
MAQKLSASGAAALYPKEVSWFPFLLQIAETPGTKCGLEGLWLYCTRPPLWSNGQSSLLQIRRPGFDSRQYHKKKVVGLELGPLSLVNTTEEPLDRKVAASV